MFWGLQWGCSNKRTTPSSALKKCSCSYAEVGFGECECGQRKNDIICIKAHLPRTVQLVVMDVPSVVYVIEHKAARRHIRMVPVLTKPWRLVGRGERGRTNS